MKHKIAWALVFTSIAILAALQIFQPFKKMEIVADSELEYAGEDKEGESWYWVFKEEAKDWIEILCKATPLVATILAFLLKGKGPRLRQNPGGQQNGA